MLDDNNQRYINISLLPYLNYVLLIVVYVWYTLIGQIYLSVEVGIQYYLQSYFSWLGLNLAVKISIFLDHRALVKEASQG